MAVMNPLMRCDSYGWTNVDSASGISNHYIAMGFVGDGNYIDGVVVRLKVSADCTAVARARIYNTWSGTWGSTAYPSGTPVATGDNVTVLDIYRSEAGNLGYEYLKFPFSTKYQTTEDAQYMFVIELVSGSWGSASYLSIDTSSPSAAGNAAMYSGTWGYQSWDIPFAVLSTATSGAHTSPILVGPGAVDFGTGAIAPGIPSGNTGDLLLLVCETTYGNTVSAPTGWTEKTSFSPLENSSGTSLFLFYRVATGSEGSTVTVADPGDHVIGQVFRFRYVSQYALFAAETSSVQTSAQASATQTMPSIPDTVPEDSMFVCAVGVGVDTETEDWFTASAWNDDALSGPGHTIGNQVTRASGGGGFTVIEMTWASGSTPSGSTWVSFTSSEAWNGFIILLSARSSVLNTPSKFALTWSVQEPFVMVSTPLRLKHTVRALSNLKGDQAIVDSYDDPGSPQFALGASQSYKGAGQSFLPSSTGTLDSARLKLQKVGSPTGTIYCRVYNNANAYGSGDDEPTGAAIAEASIDIAGVSPTAALHVFNFDNDIELDSGSSNGYIVTIEYNGGDASKYLKVYYDSSGAHTGNTVYSTNGSTWSPAGSWDTPFEVYAIATGAAGVTVSPAKVTSTWSVGTATIKTGWIVTPSTVAASWSVETASVLTGITFTVEKVSCTWSANTATVVVGAHVSPTVLETQWTILAPTLVTGAIVSAAKVSTAWAVQTPEIQTGTTFAVAKVACAWTVQTANISLGARVSVDKVTGAWSVLTPSIFAGGAVTVTPSELSVQWTVKDTGITTGVVAEPGAVSATWSVIAPTVAAQSGEIVSAEKVSATWSVKTHIVKTGAITIQGDVWKCQNRTNDRLMQHTGDFHGVYATVPAGMKRITGVWWKSVWAIAEGTVAMQVLDRSTKTVLATRTLPPCSAGVWRFTPLDYAVSETDTIYVGMKALADVNIGFSYYSGDTHPGFEVRNDPSNAIDWTESSSSWEVGNFNLCFEKSAKVLWAAKTVTVKGGTTVEPAKVSAQWAVHTPTVVATAGVVVEPTKIELTWSVGTPTIQAFTGIIVEPSVVALTWSVETAAVTTNIIVHPIGNWLIYQSDYSSAYPAIEVGEGVGNSFLVPYSNRGMTRVLRAVRFYTKADIAAGDVVCKIYYGSAAPPTYIDEFDCPAASANSWVDIPVNVTLNNSWAYMVAMLWPTSGTVTVGYNLGVSFTGIFMSYESGGWGEASGQDCAIEAQVEFPLYHSWAFFRGGGYPNRAITGARFTPDKVSATWSVGIATVALGGNITVPVEKVSCAWTVETADALTGVLVSATAVDCTWSVETASISAGALVLAAAVGCTWTINTATVLTGALVQPAKVSGAWSINTPTVITGAAVVVTSPVDCTWSVNTPTVTAEGAVTATPSAVVCTWSTEAPTIITGAEVEPSKLALTWTVQTPTVSIGTTVEPTALAGAWTIGTMQVKIGARAIQGDVFGTYSWNTGLGVSHVNDTVGQTVTIPSGVRKIVGVWLRQYYAASPGEQSIVVLNYSTKALVHKRYLQPVNAAAWHYVPLDCTVTPGSTYIVGIRCEIAGGTGLYYTTSDVISGNLIAYDPSAGYNWQEWADRDIARFIIGFEKPFATTWGVGSTSHVTGAHFTTTKVQLGLTIRTPTIRIIGGEGVWYEDSPGTGVWTKDEAESGAWTEDEAESGSWTENPPGSH